MSSAPVYNHPNANPLLGPLNQLGNLLNTNYTNSWTLRKLIQDNATYILAQLERIRQTVTTLQQNFTNARTQIPQLERQIRDLQTQLDLCSTIRRIWSSCCSRCGSITTTNRKFNSTEK